MPSPWDGTAGKPLASVNIPITALTILRMPKEGEEGGYVRLRIGDTEIVAPYTLLSWHRSNFNRGEIEAVLPIELIEIVPEMRR